MLVFNIFEPDVQQNQIYDISGDNPIPASCSLHSSYSEWHLHPYLTKFAALFPDHRELLSRYHTLAHDEKAWGCVIAKAKVAFKVGFLNTGSLSFLYTWATPELWDITVIFSYVHALRVSPCILSSVIYVLPCFYHTILRTQYMLDHTAKTKQFSMVMHDWKSFSQSEL